MKKIALFISCLQKGGSERVMVNLAEYFNSKGYEVLLVTQYKKEVEYEISPEIKRVLSEPEESLLTNSRWQNFKLRCKTLRNIWKEFKPDLVLSFIGKNNFMAIITSLFLPHKLCVSVRGNPASEYAGGFNRLLMKLLFPIADLVILQTNESRGFFTKRINKKSVVLPNPLNPVFLNTEPVMEKENTIMATGRLDYNKNHAMLINAFSQIAKEYPDMKLVIFGEGEKRAELEELIAKRELQDRIELPGSVSDVADKIKKTRIFALTSYTEGLPNSIMEAMALGAAVVSTNCPCGGPLELIENEENGILVPVGDANALADAFRKILSDEVLEKKLQENALKLREEYHPDNVNKKWEEAFWSLFM